MSQVLANGTPIKLRVNEYFKSFIKSGTCTINSLVYDDVYSIDGTKVLIRAGTPAHIWAVVKSNGSWGSAGRLYIYQASTRTIDNKQIFLQLNRCIKGKGRIGWVILLSLIFFPYGLFSGFMKGRMPQIRIGTIFYAYVMRDVTVE